MIFDQSKGQKDVKGILQKYLRYWYLFILGAAIAIFAALVYLRYTTPLYVASTTLMFKDQNKGGGLSETAAFSDIELLNASKSIDNEILILKSLNLMKSVITALKIERTFIIEGQIRDVEIYGVEVPIDIIIEEPSPSMNGKVFRIHFKDDNSFILEEGENRELHQFGKSIEKEYGKFTIVSIEGFTFSESNQPLLVKFHDRNSIAKHYSNGVNVRPVNSQASALNISVKDPVPEKARDILEKLIEVYEKESVDDKNQIAAKTVEFIDDRLDYLTQELSRVEQNVEKYKQEMELTNVDAQAEQYITAATENRKEVEQIDIQLDVLRSIERYLENQETDDYKLVPTTLTIQDITLNELITRFNQLQQERERSLGSGTRPTNPYILNINEQLQNLKQNVLENLRNIKNGLQITRRNLMAKSGLVDDQINKVPMIERQLIEITRQQEIKQAIYLYLLQKKEESALSLAATVSNTRIIDPPYARGPVSPVKSNILAYSLIMGLFIPFVGIYLKYLLTNRIERKGDVTGLTQTPILGEVCHSKEKEFVVSGATKKTPIAEMFRLIRTNLHYTGISSDTKCLLVTSSMSGEGKSFFCTNIGMSFVGTGKSVLIIEFDLRRPKLLKNLGIERKKGLTDYIVGDIDNLEKVVIPTGLADNLDILPAGTLPPNPAELMLSERVGTMISELKKVYDYIILDTAPVGKVADAFALKPYSDLTVYIIRYNYTDKKQLAIIDEIFQDKKLNNPMIVLNDSKKSNNGGYTYGY